MKLYNDLKSVILSHTVCTYSHLLFCCCTATKCKPWTVCPFSIVHKQIVLHKYTLHKMNNKLGSCRCQGCFVCLRQSKLRSKVLLVERISFVLVKKVICKLACVGQYCCFHSPSILCHTSQKL